MNTFNVTRIEVDPDDSGVICCGRDKVSAIITIHIIDYRDNTIAKGLSIGLNGDRLDNFISELLNIRNDIKADLEE